MDKFHQLMELNVLIKWIFRVWGKTHLPVHLGYTQTTQGDLYMGDDPRKTQADSAQLHISQMNTEYSCNLHVRLLQTKKKKKKDSFLCISLF